MGIIGPRKQDWRPAHTSDKGGDLLTQEERELLQRLRKTDPLLLPEGLARDLDALRKAIDRLSRIKPDDFDFPEYAALVNPISCTAFAMRFDGRWSIDETLVIRELERGLLSFTRTTESQPCDALLATRAYVRVAPQASQLVIEELRKAVLTLSIDGEPVIDRESLAGYLALPDGWGVRRIPRLLRLRTQSLFTGVGLNDEAEADPGLHYGIMLPNGSQIQMELGLNDCTFTGPVTLAAGLVLGRYTTKARV